MPGPIGETIKARLEEMIVIKTDDRLPARLLLPRWFDLYRTVIRRSGPKTKRPSRATTASLLAGNPNLKTPTTAQARVPPRDKTGFCSGQALRKLRRRANDAAKGNHYHTVTNPAKGERGLPN